MLLIAAYLESLSGDPAEEVAGAVIGALLFPGIIFGIVHAVKKKKPSILLFGILFLLFSASSLNANYESVMNGREQFENFNEKLIEMQQKSANMDDWEPYKFDENTYGKYSELGEMTQAFFIDYNRLNRELMSDLQVVTADKVLAISVLQSHSKIQSEIANIERFEGQFDVYKQDVEVVEADYLNKLDELSERSSSAKAFKKGYLEGLKTSHAKTAEIFEKTREMTEVMKEILNFMEAREAYYMVENDQVFFSRDSDVKLYNDLIQKLNQVGEELTKLGSETTSMSGQ